jgi:hypothetical protein
MKRKSHWSQPSLSRDFSILAGVILFVLVVLSAWITWSTYTAQSSRISEDLQKEATRIDNTLARELKNAEFLLHAISKQVANIPPNNTTAIARLLQAYQEPGGVVAMWAWTNANQELAVSSNLGVLEKPVNVADREHIQKAVAEPGQVQISGPIAGRVSKRWVIPISIGITDDTGKQTGVLAASIDIGVITEELSYIVKREGVSFAVISKSLIQLTEVSETPDFVDTYFPKAMLESINIKTAPSGIVSRSKLFSSDQIYAYYQVSTRYPYILLVGYDSGYSDNAIRTQLLPRLLQIGSIAVFLIMFLWIVRVRILKPIVTLETIAADLTRGKPYTHDALRGPVEIDSLATQIAKVSDFILERERLETELRDKLNHYMQAVQDRQIKEQRLTEE